MVAILKYIVINTLFALSVYYGLYVGHSGALNIMKFWIWAIFVISVLMYLLALNDEKILAKFKQPKIPLTVNSVYEIAIILALVYVGWFGYATVYAIHSFLVTSIAINAKEYNSKISAEEEENGAAV